ncbi:fructose-bisphosphate aldolase [Paramyrothecium foliicola]|nr:fructose-bisphosphate aldolase [Paramyrothecium foliicola]
MHQIFPQPQTSILASHVWRDSKPEQHPRPEETEAISDASVHAFLRRVSGHLAMIGQGLPRNLFHREVEVDGDTGDVGAFVLPTKQAAHDYVTCYFDHASVTYRYIPRQQIFELLEQVYNEDDNEAIMKDQMKMAILLLVMGIGCIWTASWRNKPLAQYKKKASRIFQAAQVRLDILTRIFPPTLGVVQAQLLKTQLEVSLTRFNSAWMSLGVAVRMGQTLGIHKNQASADPLEAYCRKGTFWTIYMLDRYLSVSLGRPTAIHDQDVTVSLPSEPDPSILDRVGAQEVKISAGVLAHSRLTRIASHAVSRLYRGPRGPIEPLDQIVAGLEKEINQWLLDTPDLFHPSHHGPLGSLTVPATKMPAFYDLPWIFKRQQRTIQSAFYFTNMLIYRTHLLKEFLNQVPSTPLPRPSSKIIKKCMNNALAMARIAAEIAEDISYNSVYWTTSYFTFCAISVLVVYLALYQDFEDRAVLESVVEKAMKGHRKLGNTDDLSMHELLEANSHSAEANMAADQLLGGNQWQSQHHNQNAGAAFELLDNGNESIGHWDATGFGLIMDIGFDGTAFLEPNALEEDM